jgi:hypothetical protein
MADVDFIGRGLRFPIKVNSRGRLDSSDGPDRVQDSIWIIVRTALGERLMRPRFGAGATDFVFQPNSTPVRTALTAAIKGALLEWEPRIDLEDVRVEPVDGEPSQVLATIEYRLRATNEPFNAVISFFLEEGVG